MSFSIWRRAFSTRPQLQAVVRSQIETGSKRSRMMRSSNNLLPGVVYGVDSDRNILKILVKIDKTAVKTELRTNGKSFENTIYELSVQGENKSAPPLTFNVVPRSTQFCALTLEPLAVNFLVYYPGTKVSIPLVYINQDRSADLKRGSFIYRVNKFLDCVCGDEIPPQLEIDVSDAGPGQIYKLDSINFPPNVRPAKTVSPDFIAAVVKTPKGG